MKLFSINEVSSNCFNRAINDIRLGLPIVINKKHLVVSIETLSESHFNKLKRYFKDKLYLVSLEDKACKGYNISKICLKDIRENIIISSQQGNIFNFQEITWGNEREPIIQLAKKLSKYSKLRPVFLFAELDIKDNKFLNEANILHISKDSFNSYEKLKNSSIEQVTASVPIKLKNSNNATITMFRVVSTGEEHCAISIGDVSKYPEPLVRIHSSCYTGDLLESLQCDCNNQLHGAIRIMSENATNAGVIVYLMQEGRGIGLVNKLRAYNLQSQGYDTVEANEKLGFDMDEREYSIAAEILKKLKIDKARLLTNNPYKVDALVKNGIAISEVLPLMTEINIYNEKYITTKRKKMAHAI